MHVKLKMSAAQLISAAIVYRHIRPARHQYAQEDSLLEEFETLLCGAID